jgi:hypothetical protein
MPNLSGDNLMNKIQLLISASILTLFCNSALADLATINRLFGKLPSITPYERYCMEKFSTTTELSKCISNIPNTSYYNRERQRGLNRVSQLTAIAIDLRGSGDLPPWEKYCLFNSTPQCMEACVQGWVCSSN